MLKRLSPRWLSPPRAAAAGGMGAPALSPPLTRPVLPPGRPVVPVRWAVGAGRDGSAVTFSLVTVPRLVQGQTFAMGPTAALFLLLMLGASEAKRTAGKASSVLRSPWFGNSERSGKGKNKQTKKKKPKKTLLGVCAGGWKCARW